MLLYKENLVITVHKQPSLEIVLQQCPDLDITEKSESSEPDKRDLGDREITKKALASYTAMPTGTLQCGL